MEFEQLLKLVGEEPVFETSLLLAGDVDPNLIRLQLARWTKSGRLYQLRRGLYALAPPYQKVKPHPFLIANRMQRASYVSLQSALAFYGMIPEIVQSTVSVTAGRPARWETPLGVFEFRHIQPALLRGYRMVDVAVSQQALIAAPEKALLDLIYLEKGGEQPAYLHELRLQNLDRLDLENLHRMAEIFAIPKLRRATKVIAGIFSMEDEDYQS